MKRIRYKGTVSAVTQDTKAFKQWEKHEISTKRLCRIVKENNDLEEDIDEDDMLDNLAWLGYMREDW